MVAQDQGKLVTPARVHPGQTVPEAVVVAHLPPPVCLAQIITPAVVVALAQLC